MKVKHGNVIKITFVNEPVDTGDTLTRTMSTYHYGDKLRARPLPEEEYIVVGNEDLYGEHCVSFLLVDKNNNDVPIGFALVYENEIPHVVITQYGFEPEPVNIELIGHSNDVPQTGVIGSQMLFVKM
jgi:hypothetical protein